jgi:hypothetical protein
LFYLLVLIFEGMFWMDTLTERSAAREAAAIYHGYIYGANPYGFPDYVWKVVAKYCREDSEAVARFLDRAKKPEDLNPFQTAMAAYFALSMCDEKSPLVHEAYRVWAKRILAVSGDYLGYRLFLSSDSYSLFNRKMPSFALIERAMVPLYPAVLLKQVVHSKRSLDHLRDDVNGAICSREHLAAGSSLATVALKLADEILKQPYDRFNFSLTRRNMAMTLSMASSSVADNEQKDRRVGDMWMQTADSILKGRCPSDIDWIVMWAFRHRCSPRLRERISGRFRLLTKANVKKLKAEGINL